MAEREQRFEERIEQALELLPLAFFRQRQGGRQDYQWGAG